jgi:hypothetical protein
VKPSDVPAGPLAVDTDVFSFVHYRKGRYADFAALIQGHALALPLQHAWSSRATPVSLNAGLSFKPGSSSD